MSVNVCSAPSFLAKYVKPGLSFHLVFWYYGLDIQSVMDNCLFISGICLVLYYIIKMYIKSIKITNKMLDIILGEIS